MHVPLAMPRLCVLALAFAVSCASAISSPSLSAAPRRMGRAGTVLQKTGLLEVTHVLYVTQIPGRAAQAATLCVAPPGADQH